MCSPIQSSSQRWSVTIGDKQHADGVPIVRTGAGLPPAICRNDLCASAVNASSPCAPVPCIVPGRRVRASWCPRETSVIPLQQCAWEHCYPRALWGPGTDGKSCSVAVVAAIGTISEPTQDIRQPFVYYISCRRNVGCMPGNLGTTIHRRFRPVAVCQTALPHAVTTYGGHRGHDG